MARVLVTGATGTVGSAVLAALAADGHEAVAGLRRPGDAGGLPAGTHAVAFDFTAPGTWGPALEGCDGLFLLRPPAIADAKRYVNPVVDAAHAAGVRHVAFLSVLGAEKNPLLPHRATERHLQATPGGYTLLRAANFMQNFATQHAEEIRRGELFVPAGRGRTGYVDARDVGGVAARALAAAGGERRALALTGPEAITHDRVAAVLSDVLGRPVRYARPGALRFALRRLRDGTPAPLVAVMTALYTATRLGLAARVTDEVERALGRPATPFRRFAEDYRNVWARP